MTPAAVLRLIAAAFDGLPGIRLEYSVRLRPGHVEISGRFCCWISHSAAAAGAVAGLLRQLGAPDAVAAEPLAVSHTLGVSHGIAVGKAATGIELRYYRHSRAPGTLADDYHAWRWQAGDDHVATRRYVTHYLPETPDGVRPLDLVPKDLRPAFSRLLAEPRLVQSSVFWLRQRPDGRTDQLDLAFPWSPQAGDLPGMDELGRLLTLPPGRGWQRLPVRHVAVSLTSPQPEVTLYVAAPLQGAWPTTQAQLRRQVTAAARQFNRQAETGLYAKLPPLTDASAADIGTFYNGEIDLWRQVLGAGLHYHFGIFDDQQTQPDQAAMVAAQRRAVAELYPLLPQGKRIYDIGCGWGGPMSMWVRDLGSPTLGLTISRDQYRHIAGMGLPVRLGNAETTLPPGYFECAVMLESLCHMQHKQRLLQVLRHFCGRLVMRVHCQDAAPPGTVFGGTMHMISSTELRRLLESAGWTIRHWQNRRFHTLPNFDGWNNTLRNVPPTGNAHIELLRTWSSQGAAMKMAWAQNNPLIEVMAD